MLTGEQLGAFRNNGYDIAPFLTENANDHVKLIVPDRDNPAQPMPTQDDGHLDWPPGSFLRSRDYTPRRFDAAAGSSSTSYGTPAVWPPTGRRGPAPATASTWPARAGRPCCRRASTGTS